MDKIKLNRIELFGSIGVLEEEKTSSQRYWITVEIGVDLKSAGESDNLELTIDYSVVFLLCKSVMINSDFQLIEAYAESLAKRLFQEFEMAEIVSIEVLKPDAPIRGTFESVGIEVTRTRNG